MQALSVVLGERRNARIATLETCNAALKDKVADIERRMECLMGEMEAAACVCDRCKIDIYLSSRTFNDTMRSLRLMGWNHTYLVTTPDAVSYYGTCPRCDAITRRTASHHVVS
jgi:hypothetical protein